jgi:hypothetical protein
MNVQINEPTNTPWLTDSDHFDVTIRDVREGVNVYELHYTRVDGSDMVMIATLDRADCEVHPPSAGDTMRFWSNGGTIVRGMALLTDHGLLIYHYRTADEYLAYVSRTLALSTAKKRWQRTVQDFERRNMTIPPERLDPTTLDELTGTIQALTMPKVIDDQGYQDAADALWKSALAAFNYVAHTEEVTGFQASYAVLEFVRRALQIDGPFALVRGEDVLYPQTDPVERVRGLVAKWRTHYAERARELLADAGPHVATEVLEHWRELAGDAPDGADDE